MTDGAAPGSLRERQSARMRQQETLIRQELRRLGSSPQPRHWDSGDRRGPLGRLPGRSSGDERIGAEKA